MARRRSEARWKDWQAIVAEQDSSGQTVAEFCRRRKLNPSSFYAWRRKLSAAAPAQRDSPSTTATAPMFVPLPLMDSVAPQEVFEVKLPNGVSVTVPARFEAAVLASLLQAATALERGNA